jgi:hypothetical protein
MEKLSFKNLSLKTSSLTKEEVSIICFKKHHAPDALQSTEVLSLNLGGLPTNKFQAESNYKNRTQF